VSRPFREHLEVENAAGGNWLRCAQCGHRLCASDQDWKAACRKKTFPPTKAGPLMDVLDGRYLLEKLYCPSCNVLLNADMVEVTKEIPQQRG
jgi:acetone carboxylase gamma subunit